MKKMKKITIIFISLFLATSVFSQRKYNFIQNDDLIISQERVLNIDYVTIAGHNTAVGTSEETIIENGGVYPFPSTAEYLRVKAGGDANDSSAGTGARTVEVVYLDSFWIEQTDTLTLNGALISDSTTFKAYRVQSFQVLTAGAYGGANTGNITLENSASGQNVSYIAAGDGTAHSAVYSVPAGKVAWVSGVFVSTGATDQADVYFNKREDADIFIAPFSPKIQLRTIPDYSGDTNNDLRRYTKLKPKTDFYVSAKRTSGGGDASVFVSVELIVVKEQ